MFEFRDGDIVISTRSKSGTTWVQMICALLIFRTPSLPRPLPELSPWLDWLVVPRDEVFADLESQTHRRFIKTHTPLDGLPLDERATFIVVARHPLDAAVSLYHQSHNINRRRIAELTGNPDLAEPKELPPVGDWLREWIESDVSPSVELDSFNGVFHHLTDAWSRKHEQNVLLVHYADLLDDLVGEIARIAARLRIAVDGDLICELARAAKLRVDASPRQQPRPRPVRSARGQGAVLPQRPVGSRPRSAHRGGPRGLPLSGRGRSASKTTRLAAPRLTHFPNEPMRNVATGCRVRSL